MGINRNDPLKEISGRIKRLSYEDMTKLANKLRADLGIAAIHDAASTATSLLAVADEILGPDFDINAPTTRG